MTQGFIPTSGKEWRKAREEGFPFRLDSGRMVRLRPVSLAALIRRGDIPNLLIPVVADMLWRKSRTDDRTAEQMAADDSAEEEKWFFDLSGVIIRDCLVAPRVVDNPQADDEISLDDISFSDQLAIYRFAKLPAEVLEMFLPQQNGDVATLPAGEDIQPTPQPTGAGG